MYNGVFLSMFTFIQVGYVINAHMKRVQKQHQSDKNKP